MILTGHQVQVYFNKTRRLFSIRLMDGDGVWRVKDYTERIVLYDAKFIVQKSGSERVKRTKLSFIHAWVQGECGTYCSANTGKGISPLAIWQQKELCVREVVYDPLQHDSYVRVDSGTPVTSADIVTLVYDSSTIEETSPAIWAFRKDMWDEFTKDDAQTYDRMLESANVFFPTGDSAQERFVYLVHKGIAISIPSSDESGKPGNRYSLVSDAYQSPFNERVWKYGYHSWGFWDESDSQFHDGYATESLAIQALKDYAAQLELP